MGTRNFNPDKINATPARSFCYDRVASLTGVANTIAKRMTIIRELAAEKGQGASAAVAREFKSLCNDADIRGGPISTSEMLLIAVELVPEALGRSRIDVGRLAA
jgi:hypothetical protein